MVYPEGNLGNPKNFFEENAEKEPQVGLFSVIFFLSGGIDVRDKYIKLEDVMDGLRPYERFEVIQDLIKRIESLPIIEVSEDCISREYLRSKVYDADDDDLVVDWDDIANVPSVIPSRPHDTERTDENGIQIDGEELVPRTEYELTKQALRYTQAELRASRPRSEWIRDPENQGGFTPGGNAVMSCSYCGWIYGAHRIIPDYNYCPKCGADMREEEK